MPARSETTLLHHGGRAGHWGSLGWWGRPEDGVADYHGACAALACRVGRAAGLNPGARVLSVACGGGEELRLWAQHFRAGAVLGVEQAPALVQQAAALNQALPAVRVRQGSGSALLALGLPEGSFDHVLCVDAAYHLQPRPAFLQAALRLLRPGGTLAYTDLLRHGEGTGGLRGALLGLGAHACGLAPGSLADGPTQLQRLRQAGYTAPTLQPLDDAVLGGFVRFVGRQGRRLPGGPWQAGWRRVALTAWLIPPCRAAGLGYALLSARKPLAPTGPPGSGAACTAAATASAERTALSSSGTPASA
jgi:SAM-dependent methyltransferase